MQKVTFILKLDKDLRDSLRAIAKNKGLTLSGYIRMLLIENVNKEK